jgi:hypothetical protein
MSVNSRIDLVLPLLHLDSLEAIPSLVLEIRRTVKSERLAEVMAALVATLPPASLAEFERVFGLMADAIARAEAAKEPS